MTLFLDTSAPGQSAITASQQVYEFGAEVDFYLAVASNLISGQTTGPSAQFTIYSRKAGPDTEQVDYGTTNTTYARKRTGYLINVTIPVGTVNLRVVVSSDPNPLTVQTVAAATISGTSDINIKQVAGNATPGESGGLPVGVGGQIYDARMLLDASGVNLGKVYSTGQVSHSQDAVTSQGGVTAPAVSQTGVIVGGASKTYFITASPPATTRWKLWGVAGRAVIAASTGTGMAVTALQVDIYQNVDPEHLGPQWLKTEAFTANVNESIGFGAIPTGATGLTTLPPGITHVDFVAGFPDEIDLTPDFIVDFGITGTGVAGNVLLAPIILIPLGVQEPL